MTAGERLLAAAARRLDDRGLERAFGHGAALRAIFSEMAGGLVPRVANGFEGAIQYDLHATNGRIRVWTIRVGAVAAAAQRGRAASPALVVQMRLADFLRLAAGEITPLDLLKARRLHAIGDGLLASRLGPMFGRPAERDIYVAPPAIDPPTPSLQEQS